MKPIEQSTEIRYAICPSNEGYEIDLIPLKVYAILPPSPNESELDALRVIDETDEDYLYPTEFFAPVELSETNEKDIRRILAEIEAERG